MYRKLVFLSMIASFGVIAGCDDDKVVAESDPKVVVDFPNGIGNEWVYAYYDSIAAQADTVRVKITAARTLSNGESARVWQCRFDQGQTDTHLVAIVGDTVKLYWGDSTEPTGAGIITVLFPMIAGRGWTRGSDADDSTTITEQIQMVIPAGWFHTAYRLDRVRSPEGYTQRSTVSYIPEVGIGSMYLYGGIVGPFDPDVKETWVLVRYDFPD